MLLKFLAIKAINKAINGLRGFTARWTFESMLDREYRKGGDFFFIQIGAHDGVQHDFMYRFLTERRSKGIMVEPIASYHQALCRNFSSMPELRPLRLAVHESLKSSVIYKVNPKDEDKVPDWAPASASFDRANLTRLGIPDEYIIEEIVECGTFRDIVCRNYSHSHVDLLQIDAEGYDFAVLKMINFDELNASILRFEHVKMTSAEYSDVLRLVKANRYIAIMEGNDTICYRVRPLWAKLLKMV